LYRATCKPSLIKDWRGFRDNPLPRHVALTHRPHLALHSLKKDESTSTVAESDGKETGRFQNIIIPWGESWLAPLLNYQPNLNKGLYPESAFLP
jgi:hypothetical protein